MPLKGLVMRRSRTRSMRSYAIGGLMLAFLALLIFYVSTGSPASSRDREAIGSNDMVSQGRPTCPPPGADLKLTGAGSTFDFPLFSKWIDRYEQLCSARVNYQSIGSGAGIAQITARTVDFGASDGIMTDDQVAKATAAGGPILHIAIT